MQVTIGEAKRDGNAVDNRGASAPTRSGSAALGLTCSRWTMTPASRLGLKDGQGVVIDDITGPVAAQSGLRAGDVILMVNQRKVGSVAEFQAGDEGRQGGQHGAVAGAPRRPEPVHRPDRAGREVAGSRHDGCRR
ncbi:PDZ domain-containing protein [Rhodanobacter lindaniclasticus]